MSSGRGLCDGLITRPEESYRLWRVVVCDQETPKTRRLNPATGYENTTAMGCNARKTNKQHASTYRYRLIWLTTRGTGEGRGKGSSSEEEKFGLNRSLIYKRPPFPPLSTQYFLFVPLQLSRQKNVLGRKNIGRRYLPPPCPSPPSYAYV